MRPNDREVFRRRARLLRLMSEAAVLPPDDPRRRRVEETIVREGEWAELEWLDILRFNEELRLHLREPEPPPGFEEHLLSIPREAGPRSRPGFRAWRWAAAAGVLVLAAGLLQVGGLRRGNPEAPLRTVASLAMLDHTEDRHVTVATGDPSVLERALSARLPFRPVIPDLGPEMLLRGGRRCILDNHPVLFSLWTRRGKEYSLFQFRPEDFDLPDRLEEVTLVVVPASAGRESCEARIWIVDRRGYVLVG